MSGYILRRFGLMVPVALGASVLVFFFVRIAPGDVVDLILGEGGTYTEADAEALRDQLGLDEPYWLQYARWMGNMARGDFGESLLTGRPVGSALLDRAPVTLELTVLSLLLALAFSIPFGVLAAYRRGGWADYVIRLAAVVMYLPSFWLATLLILVLLKLFNWTPSFTYVPFTEDPLRNLEQMILPAVILATNLSAVTTRMTRNAVIDVLSRDYIRTARAKGMPGLRIAAAHTIPNALLPVITVVGVQAGVLLSGTAIIESVFNIQGVGTLMLDAITKRDYVMVQSLVFLAALMVAMVNLLVDLLYGVIDPRIRLGGQGRS